MNPGIVILEYAHAITEEIIHDGITWSVYSGGQLTSFFWHKVLPPQAYTVGTRHKGVLLYLHLFLACPITPEQGQARLIRPRNFFMLPSSFKPFSVNNHTYEWVSTSYPAVESHKFPSHYPCGNALACTIIHSSDFCCWFSMLTFDFTKDISNCRL